MSPSQRKKLAKAARELAMECVAGTAPEFRSGTLWYYNGPGCAMGHLVARCGAKDVHAAVALYDKCPFYERTEVVAANDRVRDGLPWTLLALADELESTP